MRARTKKLLMYGVPIALGAGAIIYYVSSRKPTVEEVPGVAIRKPTTTREQLIQIASKQLHLPESELTVRGLTPEDLNYSTPSWSTNLTPGWNTVASGAVADSRFIAITGLYYYSATPIATQVKITAGGATRELWSVQHVPSLETPSYTDPSPTMITQNQSINIQIYSTGTGTETISFEGIVVEKRGLVVA